MNSYVTFTSTGIKVDLARFLKTEAGKELLRKVELASKRFERTCPACGSHLRSISSMKTKP